MSARTPAADAPSDDPRDEIVEHLASMRAFALSLTRNPSSADDLVHDTVVKAWSKFHLYRPGTNLRAWLLTILRNTYYSSRRKQAREVSDTDGAMTERLATKPDHDGRLALADMAAAFARLPPEQREVLILVGAMGFSIEEAAETCNCAPGTVKSRANRGRRALAAMLGLSEGEGMDLTENTTLAVISSQAVAG